jgi:UDP-N-acetyl-2-amino-2-deoxyglucuronate dehydrogenase
VSAPLNFAVLGVAGYIAPRHLQAIRDTGNRLVAASDPSDSVGILDRYAMDVAYFKEVERFDRHLAKLHRGPVENRVHWVSICTPNYLHDSHIRLALRNGANALCEKPLVINPWNLDALQEIESETGGRVYTVLQLRVHPALVALKAKLDADPSPRRRQVSLTYVTSRGPWYHYSWKGAEERSGGLATNIGVHLFDLVLWLFGGVTRCEVNRREPSRTAGQLTLGRADVTWSLSVARQDLPPAAAGKTTYRSLTIDGEEVEFSDGFTDLHTRIYETTLLGQGFGLADARPSIELVNHIRMAAR